MNNSQYTIISNFISGDRGALYSIHYQPNPLKQNSDRECFILSPPLAEEMNRCRYMCTLLAQDIARSGYGFISVDPYGTGDSEGDFSDLGWLQLGTDLLAACELAIELGYTKISLLGIRLGALSLVQIASRVPSLHRIIFWQPEINGKTALNQLLRLKIAGSLNRNETGVTTRSLEAIAESGKHLEIAGYRMSPELITGIKQASMDDYPNLSGVKIGWFHTLASEGRRVPKAHITQIDTMREKGIEIDNCTVIGPPYWQVHERTLAPNLIHACSGYIQGKVIQ